MRRMIVLTAVAAMLAIVAALAPGKAEAGSEYRVPYYRVVPVYEPVVVVYDEPPATRAYWARPWQGRHYYPFTGKKPKVGRHEDLNAPSIPTKPARSYYREWSNLSLYPPAGRLPDADGGVAVLPPLPRK